MTDHFATLQQPRRPCLEDAALQERFHAMTATLHPDVPGTGDAVRFENASAAFQTLREPATRLRHLLALEAPEQLARPHAIPPAFADHFMRLAAVLRALEEFRVKKSGAISAVGRALLASEKAALATRAHAARADLEAAYETALTELRTLDAAWPPRAAHALDQLAALHVQFAYLAKWRAQLAESLFHLEN